MLNAEVLVLNRVYPVGVIVQGARIESGEDYPNKPIRLVTTGVGSAADFAGSATRR